MINVKTYLIANSERAKYGQQATFLGIRANILLVLGKAAAGIFGYSYALITETIESGTDMLNSGIVWLGLRTAAREPDENYPYDHDKTEPLAAIATGRWGAAVYIAKKDIHHIQTPQHLPTPLTLTALGVVGTNRCAGGGTPSPGRSRPLSSGPNRSSTTCWCTSSLTTTN